MKIRFLFSMFLVAACGSLAAAQDEAPEITEARGVVLEFCQAFLDGDAQTAVAQLDMSGEGNENFARMVPLLCQMSHAEYQLYEAVDQKFGEESENTYRSSNSISTMPYSIVQNIGYLFIELEMSGDQAVLRAPGENEGEHIDIFILNKIDGQWKIDAASSLGMPLPESEEDWAQWQSDTDLFVSHLNELRQELPEIDSVEAYNQRFVEHMQALQETAEGGSE